MAEKALFWLGSSRHDVRSFPAAARRSAGFQLRRVQKGLDPTDWRPIPSVGPGAREIRVHTGLDHRVFYIATFSEGVYVIHAFEKRTRKTPRRDLELGRSRLRELIRIRRGKEKG